ARPTVEKPLKGAVGHGEADAVIEILHVELERAVFLEVNQLLEDDILVNRFTVRGQAHQLVLAGIYAEAGIIGEGGVKQAEGMRKVQLSQNLDPVILPHPEAGRGPLAHAIDGEECRFLIRGWKEGRSRMRLMML